MTLLKKLLPALASALLLTTLTATAQTTAEIHYDFGRHVYNDLSGEKPILIKLGHLSYDKWGRNYGYIRLNPASERLYDLDARLQRDIKFVDAPLALHLEYHGAMRYMADRTHAISSGISYRFHNEYVDLTVAPSYRYDFGYEKPHNFQLWGDAAWTSWNRVWTIRGFAVLRTNLGADEARRRVIFRAEPQVWCNVNQFVGVPDELNLSIGTELRMEYNTLLPEAFHVRPTIAAKWTF